ncbi:MAG: hypothetical protein K2X27_11830 [Candidatus Obscuribacterales bacterium]|nr:hypothetical protein [Candidatus Obscuribacterales bacterium]
MKQKIFLGLLASFVSLILSSYMLAFAHGDEHDNDQGQQGSKHDQKGGEQPGSGQGQQGDSKQSKKHKHKHESDKHAGHKHNQ